MNKYEIRHLETPQEHYDRLRGYLLDIAASVPAEERVAKGGAVPLSLLEQLAIYRPTLWDEIQGHMRFEHEPEFEPTPELIRDNERLQRLIEKKKKS